LAAELQGIWTAWAITKKDLCKIKKDLNNYVRIRYIKQTAQMSKNAQLRGLEL